MPLPIAAILTQSLFATVFIGVFNFLKGFTPKLVKWVLISLGIGYATYTGVDYVTDYATSYMIDNIDGLPIYLLLFAEYAGLKDALQIIAGGFTAGLTVRFGNATNIKKFRFLA